MRTVKYTAVALILTACGGGGSDTAVSPSPAAPPVAAAPAPTPAPAEPPAKAPEPPAAQTPAPKPPPPAPAPEPPAASPPPEAPFVYGYLVKAAIQSTASQVPAYEVLTGLPDTTQDSVLLSSSIVQGNWEQWTEPRDYWCEQNCNRNEHHYSFASAMFRTDYVNGQFALGPNVAWSIGWWMDRNPVLTRAEPFVIRDDDKLALNTTIAEWRAEPNFVQLQVSTFQPSSTVFRLCVHFKVHLIRRLACTLHDKDTALLRGAQILDDSAGLGGIEYRTPR